MEENILDVLGLQLVDYFINFENYQPFNIPEKFREEAKGKVYLVNKKSKSKYQVVKIIKQNIYDANELKEKDDQVIDILKKELGLSEPNFKMLILLLNADGQNEFRQSPIVDIIIATPNKIVFELEKIFPSITKAIRTDVFEEYQDDEKHDDEVSEMSDREKKWKKINFQNRRFLKDALLKSTNPHLVITWLIFALPIVAYVIFSIIIRSNSQILQGSLKDLNLLTLIFGASYRNLVYGANEYWRWLTYPLVQFDSLSLLFSLWMFYRIGRYIEGFYGLWKSLIIWVSAVILTGIVQTTVDHIQIMNGFEILTLISIGAMIPIIWNYRLFKSQIMSKLTFTFILMLLFWMLQGMKVITLLYWMIAIGSGWLVGAVVSYHNRKLTVFYAFSPIAIGLLVLFAILVAFLNPYYHYDNHSLTFRTLQIYQSFKIVSQDFVGCVMQNYFGK